MITIKSGDIFASNAQTLVNAVNCVGVMGKGVALEFKKRYPYMFKKYAKLCAEKQIKPGVPHYYSDATGASIINFPTKYHWREPSKLLYIKNGLEWFRDNYRRLGIMSVAFPALGCGNGGLLWGIVSELMCETLRDLPIEIEIYAPLDANMNHKIAMKECEGLYRGNKS